MFSYSHLNEDIYVNRRRKLEICRINRKRDSKGGNLILAYEVAAAAGSIPFIVLLSRLAHWFGFRKKDGLLIGLALTAEVLLLPFALRHNLGFWWLGLTALTVVVPTLWVTRKLEKLEKPETSGKTGTPETSVTLEKPGTSGKTEMSMTSEEPEKQDAPQAADSVYIEDLEIENSGSTETIDLTIPQVITQPQTSKLSPTETLPSEEPEKILSEEDAAAQPTLEPEITLENLIDWGFAAKNAGRYQSAAEWFSRALSLRPAPDLAYYLIMDACTLWLAVNKRDHAQELLAYYWQEYAQRLAPEQRIHMTAWLSKENLLS